MSAASTPVLSVRDLTVAFHTLDGVTTAVRDATWDLQRGQTLAIVGESGSGKSVSSYALLRLIQPPGRVESGAMHFRPLDGPPVDLAQIPAKSPELLKIRGGKIAMIFQEPMTALSPVHTVGLQVTEAIRLHRTSVKREAKAIAIDTLGRVGIPDPEARMRQYPFEFSGGMRQRVVIAMALACKPEVLIADEPTTALDVTVQAQILDLIKDLKQEMQTSVIFITHDLGVVAQVADEVVVMNRSRIVETAPVRDLYRRPLHPYTRRLLQSVPRPPASVASGPADLWQPPPHLSFDPPGGEWSADAPCEDLEVEPDRRLLLWAARQEAMS
jgi:ABC-type dipeptide/oligopeptide/nickel transport system ATPase component